MTKRLGIILLVLFCVQCLCDAAPPRKKKVVTGTPMYYEVTDKGDTVYLDTIEPVWVFPKGRRMSSGDWRRYYKLVYTFNKVYPYALVGRKMMAQVDSTMAADITKRSQKVQYIRDVQAELFKLFEGDLRRMTIREGMVLLRLVDRETGLNAYEIIKTYKSGFAAGFWQLVARLFSQNLKTRFDPTKEEDAKLERLCKVWDSGEWDSFYYSIFMEHPRKVVISSERLSSSVQKKSR